MAAPVRLLAVVAALASTAPALAQETTPFEAKGEIRFQTAGSGNSASFSDDRVVGPTVNMTRREDGGWSGDLLGHDLALNAEGDRRLTGPNVNLVFGQKGDRVEVEGLFFNTRIRVSYDGKKLTGRTGTCSFDMARLRGAAAFRGDVGCMREGQTFPVAGKAGVQLFGEAATAKPPLQQLALALVATLPM